MTDWSRCAAVESVPGRVSGAWVFTGTRLPVSSLFENLESGATVRESAPRSARTGLARSPSADMMMAISNASS